MNDISSSNAFFQRVALSTAANMCKKLPSDAADFVMEAVPLLTNLLQYHDAKVKSFFLEVHSQRLLHGLGYNSLLMFFLLFCVCSLVVVGVRACFCLLDSDC